jgi:cytochrome c-type biogenesis protein CcmE
VLNRRRFVVGAALIAAAVSYLVYAGIRTTSMYYFELGEFLTRRDTLAGQTLRVKGWVRHGSVDRNVGTNELRFELARQDDSSGIPVSYRGIMPDMFSEGREVVVEGRYDGRGLAARQIMTSCPSKYEPVVDGAPRAGS